MLFRSGGQLRDQFGGFKNVLEGISKVLTPMRVLFGGVATVLGSVSYAAYKGAEEAEKFNNMMTLLNNNATFTHSVFLDTAGVIANKYNVSISQSKDILNELAKTGNYTNKQMTGLGGIIAHIAKLSGQSGKEVAQNLIPNLDGSARGAQSLNKQFAFLTIEEYKQIEILEKTGQKYKAINIEINALNRVQSTQKEDLGILSGLWRDLSNYISNANEGLKNWGSRSFHKQALQEERMALME